MLARRLAPLALALVLAAPSRAHDRLWSAFQRGASVLPGIPLRGSASGCTLDDLDGDGVPELATGWPGASGGGRVELRSGASGALLWSVDGFAASATSFGCALERVGDVDADGHAELVAGGDGGFVVLSSASGAQLARVDSPQAQSSPRFGNLVVAVGDQDGDGAEELLVGDPQSWCVGGGDVVHCFTTGAGSAELRAARDGSLVRALPRPTGVQSWGAFVAAWPDLDGDGRLELGVAGTSPSGGPGQFELRVLASASGQALLAVPLTVFSALVRARSLLVPDVDGDGVREVALLETAGSLRLLSGASGLALWTQPVAGFAADALARAGDWDGDGTPDVACGIDQTPSCALAFCSQGPGSVRVLSGRDGALLDLLVGQRVDDRFGASIGTLGDLDGDGRAELWSASSSAELDGVPGRRVELVRGSSALARPRAYCEPAAQPAPTIGWRGTTSVARDELALTLRGAQPGALAVLLCGPEQQASAGLCVAGPLRRLALRNADASGAAVARLDLRRWTASPADALVVGSTWSFTWLVRPGASGPQAWSSALRATLAP